MIIRTSDNKVTAEGTLEAGTEILIADQDQNSQVTGAKLYIESSFPFGMTLMHTHAQVDYKVLRTQRYHSSQTYIHGGTVSLISEDGSVSFLEADANQVRAKSKLTVDTVIDQSFAAATHIQPHLEFWNAPTGGSSHNDNYTAIKYRVNNAAGNATYYAWNALARNSETANDVRWAVGLESGGVGERFSVHYDGQLKLNSYTSATSFDDTTAVAALAVDANGNVLTQSLSGGGGTIDGSGTAGTITKWVDGDTIGDSIIQESLDMIGIGTVPSYRLHIKGINTSGATDSFFFENSNGSDSFEWSNAGQLSMKSNHANLLQLQRSNSDITHRIGTASENNHINALWKMYSTGSFRYSVGSNRTDTSDQFVIGKTNNTVASGHLLSIDRGNGDIEMGEDGAKIIISTAEVSATNGKNLVIGNAVGNISKAFGDVSTGSNNTIVGRDAYSNIDWGYENAVLGSQVMTNTSESFRNVVVGFNLFVGAADSRLEHCTVIGTNIASQSTTTFMGHNHVVGRNILESAVTVSNNVAFGQDLLTSLTTGGANVSVGRSLFADLTTGGSNIAVGGASYNSLSGSSENNIGIGTAVGNNVLSGDFNILIGSHTDNGSSDVTLTDCIHIGRSINYDTDTGVGRATNATNEIVIGTAIDGQGDNTFTHGNEAMVSHHFWGKLHSISKTAGGDSTIFHFQNSDNSDNLLMNGAGRLTLSTANEIPFLINRPNGNGVLQFRNDANEGSITFFGNGTSKYGAGVIQNGDDFEFHIRSTNGTGDLPNMDDLVKFNSAQAKLHVVGATGTPLLYLEGDTTADNASNPQAEFGTLTVNRHGSMALNDAAEDDVTLIVQVNGDMSTGTQLTGTMSTTNGSSFFTGSGTSYDTQLEAGSVIEKNGDLHTVYYVNSATTGFFIDNSTDATGSHIFDNEAAKIIELKDGVGHTKLKLEQSGRLSLGINPTSSRNTWFTIDNGYTNQGSIYKTGIHLTGENAGIQIGGTAGAIGGESLMIDQASEDVGLVFKRTSHTDYKLSNKNSSTGGLTVTRDPSGTPTEQMRFGSTGVRLGRTVSGDARTDVEIDGSLMINAARMYLGTETSDSSTTTPQILAGASSPTSGAGTAAPKGSIYINLGGFYNGSSQNFIWVKYSTGDSEWVALGV